MIISHKYRFIMIKTEKTAGTSLEIALSKYLGESDVITPITPEDEQLRHDLGYRGPQNYRIALRHHGPADWARLLVRQRRATYFNHAPASFIRDHVGRRIWTEYFKFAFERNPWDRTVSMYWFRTTGMDSPPTISEFVASGKASRVKSSNLYMIDDRVAVDRVYLYEELAAAVADLSTRFGLLETPVLPHAKSGYRQDRGHYSEVLDQAARDEIARVYAREIARFGYQF